MTLAACAGGPHGEPMMAWFPTKKWDVSFTVNGFLAGLVGITCPCYWVSPTGSLAIEAPSAGVVSLPKRRSCWSTSGSTT